MIVDFIDKIVAQEDFDAQVMIAERAFAIAANSGGKSIPYYSLTKSEEQRLTEINMDDAICNFLENFEKYCRNLYGRRRIEMI